jgi:putative transposase
MNTRPAHTDFNIGNNKFINLKLPVFNDGKELQKFLETNFTESLKQFIRSIIKMTIKEEMDQFRSEIDEKIQFNGNYYRNMMSTMGKIDNIPIPRFRQSGLDFTPKSISVFDNEQDKFVQLVEQMHLNGISQRKISRIAKDCFGLTFSKNRVGKVYAEFAKQEEININSQKLDDNFEYLLLDGVYVKTKGYGWEKNKAVLLCLLGIRPNGERKIIGFSFSRSEDYESWLEIIDSVKDRGLVGKNLKLIISDDCGAIKSAVKFSFQNIPLQLCITHKLRNTISKVKHKNKKQVADDLKPVFTQETKEDAEKQAKIFCKKWYLLEPKAVETFRNNIDYCFTYYQFPKEIWHKIRTSNAIEREFRELRRRIKVFDNSFNSISSTENYANTIFTNLNQNYPYSNQKLHTNP